MKLLQCFYYTALFLQYVQLHTLRIYYAKELKNMEELYPGNKEILPVSSISVQAQERYPTRTAIGIRSE